MKNEAKNSRIFLDNEDKTSLLSEVKETVAAGISSDKEQQFGAADLWNIQKKKREVKIRRSTLWN